MRLRTLTHPKKSAFLAVTAAAAIAVIAVPASAAGAPPRDDTRVVVEAGPQPINADAAYYANIARGTADLAKGKVATADLKEQISDVADSAGAPIAQVEAMTSRLRATTARVAAQVVEYDKEQARKAAEREAARKAAEKRAAEAAAAAQAAAAQRAQEAAPQAASLHPVKKKHKAAKKRAVNVGSASGNSPAAARAYARKAIARYGWGSKQFTCLNSLWNRESGWRVNAANPSGAYGIPQALPGSKMGPGWQSSATTQINWGLSYIKGRYGTPCGAWNHSQRTGWY